MQYRNVLPHHPILDAHIAAALLTILGLTFLFFIQVLVDCVLVLGHIPALHRTYLLPHLRRRIEVETVCSYHRRPPGLPRSVLFCFRTVACLFAGAAISVFLLAMYAPVPAPDALRPNGSVAIVAEVSGRIEKVYVKEGSIVYIGDPIVQLETRELLRKKHVVENRIHSAELKRPVDRVAVERLYSELHQLEVGLSRCTITSPAEGSIFSLKPLHIGELLPAGTPLGILIPVAAMNTKS